MVTPRCGGARAPGPAALPAPAARHPWALRSRNSGRALPRDARTSKLCENNIRACDRGAPMGDAEGKLVLLAGASGLAGGYALDALLEAPDLRRVLAVSW